MKRPVTTLAGVGLMLALVPPAISRAASNRRRAPDKYQTTGRIDATDWRTGQSRNNIPVIMCTHIQVVYGGNTCAQANFS